MKDSIIMDEMIASEVLKWYEDLEEQLVEFMGYIAPTKENRVVWSSRLATIITGACGLLDSVFR